MTRDRCRVHDQSNNNVASNMPRSHGSYPANYPFYSSGDPEPRDIIPRASPSRPSSMQYSSPAASTAHNHTSAISALRSISFRDPSPPSPSMTTTYHSNIWPFTRSAAVSPSTSYNRPPSGVFSSTYDAGYYGAVGGGGGYSTTSPSMERPLPARRPGSYSRPKSIELVTPMVGR